MARPVGSKGAETQKLIRKAAIRRIYKYGFEGMNLRDLAADVSLRVGSLYNYIPQKQEFLAALLTDILQELLHDWASRLPATDDPVERLRHFVGFHIEWHTARKEEVFIGNMELRSLSSAQRRQVAALRRQYEQILQDILTDGQKRGVWQLPDVRVTTFALLSMLTGICNWYAPKGRLSQAELVHIHEDLVLRMLNTEALSAAASR